MSAPNPLVAAPVKDDSWTQKTAGAGLFYDAAATAEAFQGGDWVGIGVSVAGDALDVLSFVEDPLTGLLSAGIGWLMEHISFVSEMLDYLAGNAELVMEKEQTWNNVHGALQKTAQDYQASSAATTSIFTGQAGDLYRTSVQNYTKAASGAAEEAATAAKAMGVAGAIVGTTRGIVRDLISRFVAQAIEKAVVALATSWCSFGASVAAYIADEIGEASATAAAEGSKVSKLVSELRELQSAAEKSGTKVAEYADKIGLKRAEIRAAAPTATQSVEKAASEVETSIDRAASSFGKAKAGDWKPSEYFDALEHNTIALKHARELESSARDVSVAGKAAKGGPLVAGARQTRQDLEKQIERLTKQRSELAGAESQVRKNMLEHAQTAGRPIPEGSRLNKMLDDLKEWDERTHGPATNEQIRNSLEEAGKQGGAEQPHRSDEAAEGSEQTVEGLQTGSLVSED